MAPTNYYVDPALNSNSGTGTLGDPFGDLQYALNTVTRDATNGDQFNIKAGTSEVLGASLSLSTYGTSTATAPLILRGYTSAANDGGTGVIDCGGYTMWASVYNYIILADLECHTFGNNNGISLGVQITAYRCYLHKGASAPLSKIGFITSGVAFVVGCRFGDYGSGGVLANIAGGLIYGCYAALGTSARGLQIADRGGAIINNVIVAGATTAYGAVNNGTGLVSIIGNSIYNTAAGTAAGIQAGSSSSRPAGVILNNIIAGWSGTGGCAIEASADIQLNGFNAFYNNTATYEKQDTFIDLSANDTALGALPWVNAGSGDFDINGTVTGVTEAGYPTAFLGIASTTPKVDKGAVQAGAGTGGAVAISPFRGNIG